MFKNIRRCIILKYIFIHLGTSTFNQLTMGKGYSISCVFKHRRVRELYNKRVQELKISEFGNLNNYLSKEYFLDYLRDETGYSRASIILILNRSQKEINKRESKIN